MSRPKKDSENDKQIKRDIDDLLKVYFPKKWDKLILETNASNKSEACIRKVFV